ncbi:LON peptidase substrate-binding domain-containing protein [Deinococcus sp. YIM 77859]|uniref:LON peptidase substrate-binding domain-containing protein n=1 Tax=Deinococcus sp. YIM 77859 TaxID=1540221 RepID=UPI0009DE9927|nr:LON peptidase substrate-binding domain-containing protein [Deinococcus sp. YIM 77859]
MTSKMRVPLFPLPNVVLFPGQVLPLYVFEPRYRELLAYVQASGSPFGIVRIVQFRETSPLPLHERVSRVGTLAHLARAEQHEDGTSSILVVGGERFRVQDFDLSHAYLSAEVSLWPLAPHTLGPDAEVASARHLLADLLRLHAADAPAIRDSAPEDPLLLASFAAALLPLSAEQRETALTAPTLLDRLSILLGFVPGEARELN